MADGLTAAAFTPLFLCLFLMECRLWRIGKQTALECREVMPPDWASHHCWHNAPCKPAMMWQVKQCTKRHMLSERHFGNVRGLFDIRAVTVYVGRQKLGCSKYCSPF